MRRLLGIPSFAADIPFRFTWPLISNKPYISDFTYSFLFGKEVVDVSLIGMQGYSVHQHCAVISLRFLCLSLYKQLGLITFLLASSICFFNASSYFLTGSISASSTLASSLSFLLLLDLSLVLLLLCLCLSLLCLCLWDFFFLDLDLSLLLDLLRL